MYDTQLNILDLKSNTDLLEQLKAGKQLVQENNIKFKVAFADYLAALYRKAKNDPALAEEARLRFPEAKVRLIDSFIEEMQTDIDNYNNRGIKPDIYFLSYERLDDAPSLLIRLIEYFCLLHMNRDKLGEKNYFRYFEKQGLSDKHYTEVQTEKAITELQDFCRTYFQNNFQYQKDDELKELLLVKYDKGFDDLYDAIMEKQIIEDAKHCKTFYETLMELAEAKEEYRGNPEKLYKAAKLPDEIHNDHRNKAFEGIKKEDVIALILTLKLDIDESEKLLRAAGFQFNDSVIEKLVKSMILTQKWSCELYHKYSKKYNNMYYTVLYHRETAEDGTVRLNYRKIILDAAYKQGYRKKNAEEFFLEKIYADGEISAEAVWKQIKRKGGNDEGLINGLIERVFNLTGNRKTEKNGSTIAKYIVGLKRIIDKKASETALAEAISNFILKESEKRTVKLLHINLSNLLDEKQLNDLKQSVTDKTCKKALCDSICKMLRKENKQYIDIFRACAVYMCGNRSCTAEVLNDLKDNKISVITEDFKGINELQSFLRTFCKKNAGIAETDGSIFDMECFIEYLKALKAYYRGSILEVFDSVFELKKLFIRDLKECIKILADIADCKSKDILEQVYEDSFGKDFGEILKRHASCDFDPERMSEDEVRAIQKCINMGYTYRERIFVVNYQDKSKNIALRGWR